MVDQFPRVLGGGERVVLRTAALLQSAGYRVSIVTFAILCDPPVLQDACCPVFVLPLTGVFQWSALRAARQLGRFLRRERVAIVQTYFESSNLFGGLVTRLLSPARLIWNFRDMGILREPRHRTAYRLLRRLPDHVIAVSECVREHAIRADGIDPHRVTVMYNGLDVSRWQRTNGQPGSAFPLIVTVGNLRPVKGHDTLIEAAALVLKRFPDARFEIAGEILDQSFFETMKARCEALGIAAQVRFLGKVTDPESLLRRATLFVLPSRSEGFSNAVVEAMAVPLPVVATAVGGNAEAVTDGVTGLIVPPDQPAALADAILRLLTSPAAMQSMAEAGRRRVDAHFTDRAMSQALRELFDRVLAR